MKKTPKNVRETSVYFHCPYIIYRNVLIYMKMSAEQLENVEKKYPNKCIKIGERDLRSALARSGMTIINTKVENNSNGPSGRCSFINIDIA